MSATMMRPLQRIVPIVGALLSICSTLSAHAFDFDDVAKRAEKLAEAAYQKPESHPPPELASLNHDQYRAIHFRPDHARWRDARLPFELEFMPSGQAYSVPVKISEVDMRQVHEIRFNADDFDLGSLKIDPAQLREAGFAGFRVHYALNKPDYKDEVLVFPAASYFRALGHKQHFGLSARGLAIDTGLMSGEEFPRFTEFWVVRPGPHDKELIIYALLDSRRATGAYKFVLKPGSETVVEVQERLYLRDYVSKLGLAPLTSMFYYAKNQPATDLSYRPEVHDSDGLSIQSGTGEWIWRPLVNPQRLLVTSFAMTNPRGFGLMQRERLFVQYEDLEDRYELRPSAWVEPLGNWGAGRVELVELPTPDETNDNIVAYWVPDEALKPHTAMDLSYRLHYQMDKETRPPSYVAQTIRGRGDEHVVDNTLRFVIDFVGPDATKYAADAPVEGIISVGDNGELLERTTTHNDVTGGWRLALRMRRLDDNKPVEMRAYLRGPDNGVSETWSYVLPPGNL
jgi:glucans biosynthesis protein